MEAGELGEMVCVSACVRDDEVGGSERVPVDRCERPRRHGTGPEAPSVGNEGVGQRDQRVEDDGPIAGRAPGGGQVEVPRVTDEQDVEGILRRPEQPELGGRDARRGPGAGAKAVATAFPDADVPLDHLDAGPAEAGDHLRVPRIVALVGSEVEGPHQPLRHLVP